MPTTPDLGLLPDKPKRKRRSKAEMEAARAATAVAVIPQVVAAKLKGDMIEKAAGQIGGLLRKSAAKLIMASSQSDPLKVTIELSLAPNANLITATLSFLLPTIESAKGVIDDGEQQLPGVCV